MQHTDRLRESLPDSAKDTRLNLAAVLGDGGALNPAQRWGTALAVALAAKNAPLAKAFAWASRASGVIQRPL